MVALRMEDVKVNFLYNPVGLEVKMAALAMVGIVQCILDFF